MTSRRSYAFAAAAVLPLAAALLFLPHTHNDIATLERLAPRIERTQTISPDAREAIVRVVDRANQAVVDARLDARRRLAVERVTAALKSRTVAPELSSVGQRQAD